MRCIRLRFITCIDVISLINSTEAEKKIYILLVKKVHYVYLTISKPFEFYLRH